jgi:hypothetical protein
MPKEKVEGEQGPNLINVVGDAGNQLMAFRWIEDIEEIRRLIKETNLKTIKEYTEKPKEKLELFFPGVCEKYDSLVAELNDPNLSYERFKEIMKEVWNITHIK